MGDRNILSQVDVGVGPAVLRFSMSALTVLTLDLLLQLTHLSILAQLVLGSVVPTPHSRTER